MRKLILVALSIALLFGAVSLGSPADASPTMHNCPQDGKWAISVWTGDEADAGEALGTCGNIEVAYALTPTGAWLRYIPDVPEVNTLETLNQYDGVIALGGPTVPVAEPETNVSVYGDLPPGCTDLAIATLSAGQGHAHARTGLHTRPPTSIDGSTAMWTWTQMPVAKEVCLYCNGEFLQCADFPEASGDAHIYTVKVVVGVLSYEILPREHEYMMFEWELRDDGTRRIGRLGYGGKIPFNPTCPNDAWTWDERNPRGFWCEGYPDAEWGALRCDNPPPGEQYCRL